MAKTKFSHARVSGITGVVPERCIRIEDELEFYEGDRKLLERNMKILGLGARYVADENTTNCDMCQAAAEKLLAEMSVDRSTIDALIVATTSHDYHYPASSCILQDRLGLSEECSCYDQSGLGCTAYVYAIWQAHALVESGAAKRCLVLVGDIVSRHSDRRNRNVNMLFGDAATATLVERDEFGCSSWFSTGTRGSGWKKIIAPAGGYALPVREDIACLEISDKDGNVWHMWEDILKGMDVFKFTTDVGPKSISDVLEFSGKTLDEVDYFAFHQANKQIVRTVAMYAGLPKDKFSTETFTRYANCSSASVATDVIREFAAKRAGLTMLVSFGVGLSWGSCLLDLSQAKVSELGTYKSDPGKLSRPQQIEAWIAYFKGGNDVEG